jgi:hypothetical protein
MLGVEVLHIKHEVLPQTYSLLYNRLTIFLNLATTRTKFSRTMKALHATSVLVLVAQAAAHGYVWRVTADNTM